MHFSKDKHIHELSDNEFNLFVIFHEYFTLDVLEEELYDNLLSWSREAFGEEGVKKFNLNSKEFFDNFDEYRSRILSEPLDYIVEFCNLFLEVINYDGFK